MDRLFRCHGQGTSHEIVTLLRGEFARIPDLVVWPKSHDEVVSIVHWANYYNVVIIPYGGGTNVSGAVICPPQETRPIVSLDTSQMSRMLWLDQANLLACFEAGIVGEHLEKCLKQYGLTMGHEPDSFELSTLGGWVATRASGMKKNNYGNIEDIVTSMKMVTCKGVLVKTTSAPRVSSGPDFNHIILGSEGTLGVITEVTVIVRPVPPIKKYGALIFKDFETGIKCLREIARQRCQPASIRLNDNEQSRFGQIFILDGTWRAKVVSSLKKAVLTKIKGFDWNTMAVATLLFEGDADLVKYQEKKVYDIGKQFGAVSAGATNGRKGYTFTYVVAYIRVSIFVIDFLFKISLSCCIKYHIYSILFLKDFVLKLNLIADTFETSVCWDKCDSLCKNVVNRVNSAFKQRYIQFFMIWYRVTQTYDSGACVYFYMMFKYPSDFDPRQTFEDIESLARDEIFASGGTISHHHGIGKLRSKWYRQSVSEVGVQLFKSAKKELDPKNIFAAGNVLAGDDNEQLLAKL